MKNKNRKPNGYWTKTKCKKEAKKYQSRSELKLKNSGCYDAIRSKGWLKECCKHMEILHKPKGYWTKNKCLEEALKYKTKTEFKKNNPTAYSTINRNNWHKECFCHMELIGNRFKRLIYVIFFTDKSIYVGLTCRPKKRFNYHLTNEESSVYKHIKKTGLKPKFEILTEFLDTNIASKQEGIFEERYKKQGYNILNKAKTGALGGTFIKWTKEKCHIISLKYKTLQEFKKNYSGAYNAARNNKWLIDICSHMKIKKLPNAYWNKERCIQEALKYKTRSEFQINSKSSYKKSLKNGWLDECCKHMISILKPSGYWKNKEICIIEAKKYKSRTEFQNNNGSAYNSARNNNWLDECCKHMV